MKKKDLPGHDFVRVGESRLLFGTAWCDDLGTRKRLLIGCSRAGCVADKLIKNRNGANWSSGALLRAEAWAEGPVRPFLSRHCPCGSRLAFARRAGTEFPNFPLTSQNAQRPLIPPPKKRETRKKHSQNCAEIAGDGIDELMRPLSHSAWRVPPRISLRLRLSRCA